MSVFVDNGRNGYRGMVMCHMVAHTTSELLSMARSIGVDHRWIQKAGTPQEHFDICQSKRKIAIQNGAIPLGRHDFIALIKEKRNRRG